MTSSLIPDPLQMWRDAVTKLENEVNSIATGSTKSQEVVRSLHQFSTASLGIQRMIDKALGAYLRRANLPSRKEIVQLAETLQRIEHKLDRLLPPDGGDMSPRPKRTRRPLASDPKTAAQPAPTDKAAARRSSRTNRAPGPPPHNRLTK